MAGDGAGAHTTGARIRHVTVAVAARNGVMWKRSTRAGASHIATRMGEASHQSEAHRVRASGHDDWDRARCFSRRKVGRKRRGNDDVWIEAHQLDRRIWQAVKITIGEPKLEADVAALDIS